MDWLWQQASHWDWDKITKIPSFLFGAIGIIISVIQGKSGGEIRCQFIILARKDEPTPDYANR